MPQKLKQIFTHPVFKFRINYSRLNPLKYNWGRIKEFLKIFIIAMIAVFIVLLVIDIIKSDFIDQDEEDQKIADSISEKIIDHLDLNYFEPQSENDEVGASCNVQGIILRGGLITYISSENLDEEGYRKTDETSSENIGAYIRDAEKDDKIKAILLEVDSGGGLPVAAEEVMKSLKEAKKPTVALIRESGNSAAYWAATGADIIFASKNSNVGSIGVTQSYVQNVAKNKREGLEFVELRSGKFKDTGDPDKPLTDEERDLVMRDNKIIHENFIKAVAENRRMDIEKVRDLADGSSMLGEMALANGLIDRIGSFTEVKEYLKEKIGENVEVCW